MAGWDPFPAVELNQCYDSVAWLSFPYRSAAVHLLQPLADG